MDSHDTIYPFWRLCVTQIAKSAPSNLKIPVGIKLEVYSIEGLREFLRLFMSAPKETEQSSPIELEIIRITREDSMIMPTGREVTDRAIYYIDFRRPGQRDLIGHDYIQTEVIGAWVSMGGQFVHRVTDYDHQGRPIRFKDRRHRPIPAKYTK